MSATNVLYQTPKTFQGLIPDLQTSSIQKQRFSHSKHPVGRSLTVGQLLSQIESKPKRTMLLGQCDDGLPIMMGLDDPRMGAILVSGENSCGKTHQLQVMVDSALQLHTPDELQLSILTLHPEEWAYLAIDPHRQASIHGIHAWYDRRSENIVKALSNIAELRRDGHQSETIHLVVLDDLNFVEYLSYEAQMMLHWLLAYGSHLDFAIIATINSVYYHDFRYWIDSFRTRVLGRTNVKDDGDGLAIHPGSETGTLTPGTYRVWTQGEWLTYQLPLLGGLSHWR